MRGYHTSVYLKVTPELVTVSVFSSEVSSTSTALEDQFNLNYDNKEHLVLELRLLVLSLIVVETIRKVSSLRSLSRDPAVTAAHLEVSAFHALRALPFSTTCLGFN